MPPSSPLPRPRILQCVTHLAVGGAERVALTIVEALRNDFDFEVFAVRGMADGEVGQKLAQEVRALGVPLHIGARVPMRFGGVITSGVGMARVIRRVKPDLIHLHTEIPEAAYAAMTYCLPGARRIPLVRTIHNTVFWAFWHKLGLWCDRRMPASFVAGVSPGATETIERLRHDSGAAVFPHKPVTIYNGVFAPKNISVHPKPRSGPIRLVFGGRFEEQKGTDLIPEILSQTTPPNPEGAHLTLFGSGAHEPRLRQLAQNPPAGWTVELHAPVADFTERLANYDIVLMPSRFEGLGLIAVEAFLAGIPVIGTDVIGFREAFPDSHPWLAKAGDAGNFASVLQRGLNEPENWAEIAKAGRLHAETKFSVTTMAAGYRSLFREALAKKHT